MKPISVVLLLLVLAACSRERPQSVATATAPAAAPGNAGTGKELIDKYACLACHRIPGFDGPQGSLGPSLEGIGSRSTLAGRIPNDAATMTAYLQNPQVVDPQTQMPSVGLSQEESQHITAYLITLK